MPYSAKQFQGVPNGILLPCKHIKQVIGMILEEGTPDAIFNHPQHPRLQEFLAKVL